jgi:uncharacterized membrane protein
MQSISHIKRMTISALCSALCVVLPVAFHVIPNAGSILLPMHIPVLLCGMICGWQYGLLCGVLGPILSSVLTSMPPAAILPAMIVELGIYGCVSGLVMERLHTGKLYGDLYIALCVAMVAGRVVSGVAKALIFAPGTTIAAWATASFVTALPGILVQLIVLPTLIVALNRAGLIRSQYSFKKQEAAL